MYLGLSTLRPPALPADSAPFASDVAVQLPDKKSIIMYVTSLFAVLPKDVSMEAIREVETLPRKHKAEAEGSGPGRSVQVKYTVQLWPVIQRGYGLQLGVQHPKGSSL